MKLLIVDNRPIRKGRRQSIKPTIFPAAQFFVLKISGQKKIASKKNRTLKFLRPKKSGTKKFQRENFPV